MGRIESAVPGRDGVQASQSVDFVVQRERLPIGTAAQAVDGNGLTATVIDHGYHGTNMLCGELLEGREFVAELLLNRLDQPDLAENAETTISRTAARGEQLID